MAHRLWLSLGCACLFALTASWSHANSYANSHWQNMRIVKDTHGDWNAEHAWQQSQTEQAVSLTHPHEPVHAAGVKTVWAAWSLPPSVTQNLPVWLGIYVPACADAELWVRWNKGEWTKQSMEHQQRSANWGEGHLWPVWAIHDGTLRDIDILLKVENVEATQLPVLLQKPEAFMRHQWKFALPYSAMLVFLLSVMLYSLSLMKFFDKLALTLFVTMLCLQLVVLGWLSGLAYFLLPTLSRSGAGMAGEAAIWLWLLSATLHTRLSVSMSQLPAILRNGLVYAAIGWGLIGVCLIFRHHSHDWPAYILLVHALLMTVCCAWQFRLPSASKNLSYALAWCLYALSVGVYIFRHCMYLHPSDALLIVCGLSVLASLLLVWANCWRWMNKLTVLRARLKQAIAHNRWVAVAQHDLWQPLQSMQLYANALAAASPEQLPRILNGIQLAAGNAVACMRHLQVWYQLQLTGKSKNTELHTVSADAVLQPLFTECLAMAHLHCINLRYCRNSSVVNVNPVALQRILRNLIHNALTYTPAGGKVLMGCRRKKDCLWIYCLDNGQGMSKQQLRVCTQPHQRFSDTENPMDNHQGLGLYSVKDMAEQLGFALHMQSIQAKGSVFAIGVPLALQQAESDKLLLSHAI